MKLFFTSLICLWFTSSYCQIKATTEEGKKVILYKNGTWKYSQEKSDSVSPKISFKSEEAIAPTPLSTNSEEQSNFDCSSCITTQEDKFTGKTTIAGKGYIIIPSKNNSKNGIKILTLLVGDKNETIVCNITAIGSVNCVDEGDKVYFVCSDGTKFNLGHASDFNCKGDFTLYLGGIFGHLEELNYLATKKVIAIRVSGRSSIQEVELSDEQSSRLMKVISCLKKIQK